MGVIYTKTDQGSTITSGTGVPTQTAIAGDYYTDTTTGFNYTYTTSWQKILSGAALTYFTEAQATTGVNATVYVDSITAVSTTADADFSIRAKGTGAIIAQIPDGSFSGNKRGQYAIDFQRWANNSGLPTAVASGNYAVVLNGAQNTASGGNSLILNGSQNSATSGYATVINGYQNSASGAYSVVGNGQANGASGGSYATVINGYGNSTTGTYGLSGGLLCTAGIKAFAYGESNIASGAYSVALNTTNTASSDYSNARGYNATTFTTWGKWVLGGGGAGLGSAQKGLLVLTIRTTSNTPTELAFASTTGADARSQLTCQDNNGMRVKGSIIGKQSGSTNISAWDFDYVIVRGVGVGTTAIVGTPTVSVVTNIPAWGNPTITADTAKGFASIKVTGATTTNIQWTATIESTEVIYA